MAAVLFSRIRARFAYVVLSSFVLVLAPCPRAWAADLRNVLTDYSLTFWGRKDGLPGPIWAITQDATGFLWLGSDAGLIRFDGTKFVPWHELGGEPLPALSVRALAVTADGSLWVGFGDKGGAARVRGKAVRAYDVADGLALGPIAAFAEDRSHGLWAASANGVFRFDGDDWRLAGSNEGLPDAAATSVFVDRDGTVWVTTSVGVFAQGPSGMFRQMDTADDPVRARSLTQDANGRIWATDPLLGFRTLASPAAAGIEPGRGFRLLADSRNNLWLGTLGQGLWRLSPDLDPTRTIIERTTVLSGLPSDVVRSVFEDRDGNIWAGTTEGIDRLTPHQITPWTGLGIVTTIVAGSSGSVWAGTSDGLIRFTSGAGGWRQDQTRIPARGVRSLRHAPDGTIWAVADDGLLHIDGTHVASIPLPHDARPADIEAIAPDLASGMWVVLSKGRIFRAQSGRLDAARSVPELSNTRATSATFDRAGRLWLTLADNRIGVLDGNGRFTSYGAPDGLEPSPYHEIMVGSDHSVWISGASGLTRLDNDRFVSLGRSNGLPPSGVYAVAEDTSRRLWLATAAGILRVERDEIDAALSTPHHQLRYRLYDPSDGLAGLPSTFGDRSVTTAADGTVWFVTSRGLSVVDPRALASARPVPPISIDEVIADDRRVVGASLPAGTAKLQITYAAPDLTYGHRRRFRYRLEGFDGSWLDARNERRVVYTNLPPRNYTFHVAVTDDEGRWGESQALWTFSIAPAFYQTTWFFALAATVVTGAVWGAWALHVRRLRRQFAMVLGERVRLSQELHDTLLQSLVGVALEFEGVAQSIALSPTTARERVVRIRDRVEEYIREARQSIWSLRSPVLEVHCLVDALRQSLSRAAGEDGPRVEFEISGTPRRYPNDVEHHLLRIGQEAVLNAVRHAQATTIVVKVIYGVGGVTLRIADDGRGFDTRSSEVDTARHYGLTTMRERAEQVGGRISIKSNPGHGTVVEAMVPATVLPSVEAV